MVSNEFTERRGSGLVTSALASFTVMWALVLVAAFAMLPFIYVQFVGSF